MSGRGFVRPNTEGGLAGLTTLVGGNCGMSLAPLAGAHAPAVRSYLAPITGAFGDELCFASLADYFAAAERTPQIVNNAMLAQA